MSERPTVEQAIARFLDHFENPNTVRGYRHTLEQFARDFGPRRPIASFSVTDIDDWDVSARVGESGQPVAEATLMNRRRTIRSFFGWCESRGYVEENPARLLKIRRPKRNTISKAIPTSVLTQMVQLAMSSSNDFSARRNTAILALLVTYGLRRSDLISLRLTNVNLAEGWFIPRVKRGKMPTEPITPDTAVVLRGWLELRLSLGPDPEHDYLFVNNRTSPGSRYQPLSAEGVSSIIKSLSKKVCGYAYGTHSIRHWRGQFLADRRVPPTIVQEVLNHDDVETTLEHYYNQDVSRVRSVLTEFDLSRSLNLPALRQEDPKARTTDPDFWRKGNG